MRLLIFILLVFSYNSFGQTKQEFDPIVVKDMSALCTSFTFNNIYKTDTLIIPKYYKKVYVSNIIGLDNMFQIFIKDETVVICFRGSTTNVSSWVENFHSAMIPAKGIVEIDNQKIQYSFSDNSNAAIHVGYALAVILMSEVIKEQLSQLNKHGIKNVIFTGHSQGGAIAHLCRAYFENTLNPYFNSKFSYKTYSFANPMCGNLDFSEDYNKKYSDSSFSFINPDDFIPKIPINYTEETNIQTFKKLSKEILNYNQTTEINSLIKDLIIRNMNNTLSTYIKTSNLIIEKIISTSKFKIKLPNYANDINYFQIGKICYIQPFQYPKILLNENELTPRMKKKQKGPYFKKEPLLFQHKPYNYYVSILHEYFEEDYNKLTNYVLSEDL